MFVHRMAMAAVFAAAAAMAGPAWEGKLDAPEWPDVTPHFYDAANDPACSVRGPYFGGRFVSAAADAEGRAGGADPEPKYRLRRRFALKAAPADELNLCLNTGSSPCILKAADGGDSFTYMILPVRLRAGQ